MDVKKVSQTRWGKARFGGGSAALLSISLGIGAIASAGLGWLFQLLGDAERPVLAFTLMAVSTLPVTTALGWAALVDRSTLMGAIEKPDDSIESVWYEKAAGGAFGDILLVGGLGVPCSPSRRSKLRLVRASPPLFYLPCSTSRHVTCGRKSRFPDAEHAPTAPPRAWMVSTALGGRARGVSSNHHFH